MKTLIPLSLLAATLLLICGNASAQAPQEEYSVGASDTVQAEPNSIDGCSEYGIRSFASYIMDEFTEGYEIALEGLKADPTDFFCYTVGTDCLIAQEKHKEARKFAKQGLAKIKTGDEPNASQLIMSYLETFTCKGDTKAAIAEAEKLSKQFGTLNVISTIGATFKIYGLQDEAAKYYSQVLERDPSNAEAAKFLIDYKADRFATYESQRIATKFVKDNPTLPEAYMLRGYVALLSDDIFNGTDDLLTYAQLGNNYDVLKKEIFSELNDSEYFATVMDVIDSRMERTPSIELNALKAHLMVLKGELEPAFPILKEVCASGKADFTDYQNALLAGISSNANFETLLGIVDAGLKAYPEESALREWKDNLTYMMKQLEKALQN